ncbi:MAG: hypothetical protein KDE31_14530 [Caldilineaceae bacterium]|nr:hypothetical protein [Caldilineaceae bacterium]
MASTPELDCLFLSSKLIPFSPLSRMFYLLAPTRLALAHSQHDYLATRYVDHMESQYPTGTAFDLAGADRVISPNMMGGFGVASPMLDHHMAELWDQMLYQRFEQMRFGDLRAVDYPALKKIYKLITG